MSPFLSLIALITIILLLFGVAYCLISPVYRSLFKKIPFVPISREVAQVVAERVSLQDGDTFYDLGCGDGRVLIAVAKKFPQVTCMGVEYQVVPYLISKIRSFRYKNISVSWQNFFKTDISKASVVYVYLFPSYMDQLLEKFERELPAGSEVWSAVFCFSNKEPAEVFDVPVSQKKVYRYCFE